MFNIQYGVLIPPDDGKIINKLSCAPGPIVGQRKLPAFAAIDCHCLNDGIAKLLIQKPCLALPYYVQWTSYGISRNGNSTGQSFKYDKAKGVRPAWEDEHVGRRIIACQFLAAFEPDKSHFRVFSLEPGKIRSVTDDIFGSLKI